MSVVQIFGFPFAAGQNDAPLGLTEKQRDTVSSTLSAFDANNLRKSDVTSILAAFDNAGIQQGEDLIKAIKEEGFDPEVLKSDDQEVVSPASNHAAGSSIDIDAP